MGNRRPSRTDGSEHPLDKHRRLSMTRESSRSREISQPGAYEHAIDIKDQSDPGMPPLGIEKGFNWVSIAIIVCSVLAAFVLIYAILHLSCPQVLPDSMRFDDPKKATSTCTGQSGQTPGQGGHTPG